MYQFETVAPEGSMAERIRSAFYRYVESRPALADGVCKLRSEVVGRFERVTVSLSTEEELSQFRSMLACAPLSTSEGLRAPRRFDDLP